jgi:hypothetical protein
VHDETICAELAGAGAYSHSRLMAIRTLWMIPAVFVAWTAPAAADGSALPNSQTEDPAETEIGLSLITAFGAGGRFEDNAINRYGLGLGVRVGVTLGAPRLYLGGSFIRFIGGRDQSGEFYTSTLDAEVGYEVRLLDELLVIRPQLGLGVAQTVTIQSDNRGYPLALHGAPGILLGARLSPVLISAEVRRDLVPGEWSNAVTFMFAAGAAF